MPTAIKKNKTETIVVAPSDFKGMDLIDVRVHYMAEDGEVRPTKKGITFNRDILPEIIKALQNELIEMPANTPKGNPETDKEVPF